MKGTYLPRLTLNAIIENNLPWPKGSGRNVNEMVAMVRVGDPVSCPHAFADGPGILFFVTVRVGMGVRLASAGLHGCCLLARSGLAQTTKAASAGSGNADGLDRAR